MFSHIMTGNDIAAARLLRCNSWRVRVEPGVIDPEGVVFIKPQPVFSL